MCVRLNDWNWFKVPGIPLITNGDSLFEWNVIKLDENLQTVHPSLKPGSQYSVLWLANEIEKLEYNVVYVQRWCKWY